MAIHRNSHHSETPCKNHKRINHKTVIFFYDQGNILIDAINLNILEPELSGHASDIKLKSSK